LDPPRNASRNLVDFQMTRSDLNLFTVFDAIYNEGSVTGAAARLNSTQPAISHALNRLRALFKDQLFVRSGHAIVPTPFARSIAQDVQNALQILRQVIRNNEHFDPRGSSQRFTIAVRDVLEAAILPPLLEMMKQDAPAIAVISTHADRSTIATSLAAGSIDVAMDVLLEVPDEIMISPLAAERLCVVARHNHPVVAGQIALEDYLAADHVVVSARRQGNTFEDVELNRLGFARRARLRCQHYFAGFRVAARTDLLLTMPERYARILNRQNDNQIVEVPFDAKAMDMFLYWHKAADDDPANRWLRGLVHQSIATDHHKKKPTG
jgi:DNA-binding transcriptional LysR family regulator